MTRSYYLAAALIIVVAFASCDNDKPKPASNDINKTAVTVNGVKDSVLNNPKDNYGNSTIAEPCVKCLIKAVQAEEHYKRSVATAGDDISYIVNWVKADGLPDTIQNKKATNGLRLDVVKKGSGSQKLSSFVYDNSLARLYYIDAAANNSKIEVKADGNDLKRIRNGCYWGVASSK